MGVKYVADSSAPHFSESKMETMKKFLTNDLPDFEFDPEYLRHIRQHNGGQPINRFFMTESGKQLPIDYFLNYSDTKLLTSQLLVLLNVSVVWSAIEDRLSIYLLPFAALPDGDFLCFNHETQGRPSVVLWRHELSEEDAPYTEKVSSNFSQFVEGLSDFALNN
jgi:hypothetical protein